MKKLIAWLQGAEIPYHQIAHYRKAIMVNVLLFIGDIALFFLAFFLISKGWTTVAIVDALVLVFFLGLHIWSLKKDDYDVPVTIEIGIITLLFSYLFIFAPSGGSAWPWTFTYPMITIFLTGARKGFEMSSFLFLLVVGGEVVKKKGLLGVEPYPNDIFIRFIFIYLMILFYTLIAERVWNLSFSTIIKTQERLQETVKDLKNAEKVIKEQVMRDGLTGLYNRRFFNESLVNSIHLSTRCNNNLGLMMIDIDHFKDLNDTEGHLMGDQALIAVAEELQRNIRRKSDFVFRYGGEEFVILLHNPTPSSIHSLADAILKGVRQVTYTYPKEKSRTITVSIGGTIWDSDSPITMNEMIKEADSSMYRVKRNGRNGCCFAWEEKGLSKMV